MDHFALWVAAFLTLGIVSFLYKDNVWYKISEAIFVGISAGYWFVTLFWDNIYGKFWIGVNPPQQLDAAGNNITAAPDYWLLVGAENRLDLPLAAVVYCRRDRRVLSNQLFFIERHGPGTGYDHAAV